MPSHEKNKKLQNTFLGMGFAVFIYKTHNPCLFYTNTHELPTHIPYTNIPKQNALVTIINQRISCFKIFSSSQLK